MVAVLLITVREFVKLKQYWPVPGDGVGVGLGDGGGAIAALQVAQSAYVGMLAISK